MQDNGAHEEWRQIKGYEGYYEVSNLGRVKRIEGIKNYRNNVISCKENITNGTITKFGYLRTGLSVKNKRKSFMIHRLVLSAFIENTNNKRCVNHIDGDKQNNNILNLEWVTDKENRDHAIKNGLVDIEKVRNNARKLGLQTVHSIKGWNKKNVINIETGKKYVSITDAAKDIGHNISYLQDKIRGDRNNNTPIRLI